MKKVKATISKEQWEKLKGVQGEKGPKGDKGDRGPIGPKGLDGKSGKDGKRGPVGPKGATGKQGPQGVKGAKGDKGDKGDTPDTDILIDVASKNSADLVMQNPSLVQMPQFRALGMGLQGQIDENKGEITTYKDHGNLNGLSDDDHTQYELGVGTHKITVSDDEPSDPEVGDIWIDTDYSPTIIWDRSGTTITAYTSGDGLSIDTILITDIKTGANQAAAGAAEGELWATSGHDTLPDNVILIGV